MEEVGNLTSEASPMSYAEAENILQGLESSLQAAKNNEDEDAVAKLSDRVANMKSLLAEAKSSQNSSLSTSTSKVEMDFSNPTNEMIEEAKERAGLDLTNKRCGDVII